RHQRPEHAAWLEGRSRSAFLRLLDWNGQHDREQGAPSVGPVRRLDRTTHGFDETAANGEAQSRAGPFPIANLHAVKFVEDTIQVFHRNSLALVCNLKTDQ